MAEMRGTCTNFGNCPRAGETISVPTGGDFVCPEPDCGSPLAPVKEKKSPSKWLFMVIAGVLAVSAVVGAIVYFSGEKSEQEGQAAEEEFLRQVQAVLEDCARIGEDISPAQMKELKTKAEGLKLAGRADELIGTGKRTFLLEKRTALFKTPPVPQQELQRLCALAKKMGMPALVQECAVPPEDLAALLTQGEFVKARELCKFMANESQEKRPCTEMDTPLTVDAKFQYQLDGQQPSAFLPASARELKGLTLTSRDNFRLSFSVSQDNAFLYIFAKDHYGEIKRIFPDPVWSRGVDNPVHAAKPYQLPGEKEWLYLDELPASQTGPITESLYIFASPWRAQDIEQCYGKIHEATTPEARKDLVEKFMKQLQLRNNSSMKCLSYRELSFKHAK